jgi:uncharacterized small protein (DUF1192 family)
MTILPPAVLTTVQLVGGLVASAKNACELAKASSDHELKASVSELYDSVLDVKGRVLDLDEENRRLKAELSRKDEFTGPIEPHGYFYYKDKPEQPLCPKCFQSQPSNPVFLPPVSNYNGRTKRTCIICDWVKVETPALASSPSSTRRRPFNSLRRQEF